MKQKRERAKATLKHPQKTLLKSSSLSRWLLKKPGPQSLSSTSYMPKRTAYNELCQISPNTQNQWNLQDPYWYIILRHKRIRRIKYRHNTYWFLVNVEWIFFKISKIDDINFKKKKFRSNFEGKNSWRWSRTKKQFFLRRKSFKLSIPNFKLQILSFKFSISSFKFQISNFKDKIFFKELQKSIKVLLLSKTKKSNQEGTNENHLSQNDGTTKHSSFKE